MFDSVPRTPILRHIGKASFLLFTAVQQVMAQASRKAYLPLDARHWRPDLKLKPLKMQNSS